VSSRCPPRATSLRCGFLIQRPGAIPVRQRSYIMKKYVLNCDVLNLDKCIGCHYLFDYVQERVDSRKAWKIRVVNNVDRSPASAIPSNGKTKTSGTAAGSSRATASWSAPGHQAENSRQTFQQPQHAGNRTILRAVHLRLPASAKGAAVRARRPTAPPDLGHHGEKMEKINWGPNWEDDLGASFPRRKAATRTSTTCRRKCTRRSKTPS